MNFDHFLKTLASPALRAIAVHWNEARGTAAMPSWDQLKPSRMAPYLSIIWAYKYDAADDQFFGRLAGNAISWGLPKSFRGVCLRELWPPDTAAMVHRKMLRIISEPVIVRKMGSLFRHGDHMIEGERIALPLGGEGGGGVLGASAYKHPCRGLDLGRVELLHGDEEWFAVTPAASRVGEMTPALH